MGLWSFLAGVEDDCLSAAEFRKLDAGVLSENRASHIDKCKVCREILDLRTPKDVPSLIDGFLRDLLNDKDHGTK